MVPSRSSMGASRSGTSKRKQLVLAAKVPDRELMAGYRGSTKFQEDAATNCAQHPVDFQQILAAFTNRGARTSWANSRSPSVKAVPSRPRCFPIGNIEIKSPGVDRKSTRSGALRVAAQHLDSSDVAPSQYFHARDK